MRGIWPGFLLFLPIAVLAQSGNSGASSKLEPSRISPWRSKWSPAAVVLSSNHKSKPVTLTLYISPASTITNGILEVTFPSGFSFGKGRTGTSSGVYQLAGQSYVGGEEYSVEVRGVVNPEVQGAYGPFALRTRNSPSGQQIDVNLAFGTVYICGDAGVISGLAVSLSGPKGGNTVNKMNNALLFKFTLGVSLWRYDTFVVTIDDRWAVTPGAACTISTAEGKWNNFNGSDPLAPHSLGCVVVPKAANSQGSVYVYGLAVDGIDVSTPDNQSIQLQIAGVTTPDAVYDSYTWTVATTRFGTATTLEAASLTSGPPLLPDTLTTALWAPTWGLPTTDLVSGTSLYMDLSVVTANSVPEGGTIVIDVTEDVGTGDSNWLGSKNCYIVTYLGRNAACAVDLNTVTVSSVGKIEAKTTIKIRNIVKITSSAGQTGKILSVRTYKVGTTLKIDTGANLAPFIVSTGVQLPVSLTFQDTTSASSLSQSQAGGLDGTRLALQFTLLPPAPSDLSLSSQITIRAPLARAKDNYRISLPTSVSFCFKDCAQPEPLAFPFGTEVAPSPAVTVSQASDLGSISVTGLFSSLSGGIHLGISSQSAALDPISLPLVVSNQATAYEYSIVITTPEKATLRGVGRFLVTPQVWSTLTFKRPCDDNIDGLPGLFTVIPGVVPIPASTASASYFIEVEVPGVESLGTGLTSIKVTSPNEEEPLSFAVWYPTIVESSPAAQGLLYSRSAGSCVAIASLPSISVTTTLSFSLPLAGLQTGVVAPRVRSFFVSGADLRYKQVTHEGVAPGLSVMDASSTKSSSSFAISPSSGVNGEVVVSALSSTSSPPTAISYLYFGLPSGYLWTTKGTRYQATGTTSRKFMYFSGSRSPGALVSGGTSTTVSLAGFVLPLGAETAVYTVALGTGSGPCSVSTLSFTSQAGTISGVTVTPGTVKSRGPDGVAVTQTVSFTLQHGVPSGGSVSLTISDQWATSTYSLCSAAGPKETISCSLSGSVVTLKGFTTAVSQVSIAVQIDNLLPPSTAVGTPYDFVTALSSYSGTKVIDSMPASMKSPVSVLQTSVPGTVSIVSKRTFPMYAGAKSADLYLKFSLQHPLPKLGVITVASQAPLKRSGSGKDSCFLSPIRYSDCSYSESKVALTIDQPYSTGTVLELYLETALETATLAGFSITTSWAGVAVDSVTSETPVSFPQLNSSFLVSNLTITPTAACEPSTYTFSLFDTADYQLGDQYWLQFPQQYDYFLGDVDPLSATELSVFYLQCASEQLGTVQCSASRRLVLVSGTNAVTKGTPIRIRVFGVRNPSPGPTDQFQVFHASATGSFRSMTQGVDGVSITALVGNIAARSASVTDDRLFRAGDYSWRLYAPEGVGKNSVLQVVFPREFDIALASVKEQYPCAVLPSGQKRRAQDAGQSCPLTRNTLTFLPELAIPAGNLTTLTAETLPTPQFALPRSAFSPSSDFDVTDTKVWPAYSAWLTKFALLLYNSTALLARSYDNTHAAYLGFQQGGRPLIVNAYSPVKRTNRIVVRAGTQTQDIVLSTSSESQPLAATEITVKARTSARTKDGGQLRYSSDKDGWRMKQGQWQLRFRVAAGGGTTKGLYYVDWTVVETPLPGMSAAQYVPPPSTLVEVLPAVPGSVRVLVGSVLSVAPGFRSMPINITLANAPASNLTIHLEIEGKPADVIVTPADLLFGPDIETLTFQIQVSLSANATEQVLLFSLSGTDSTLFSVPAPQPFTVSPCSSSCSLCPEDCLQCESASSCLVCVSGQRPTYTGACKECSNCNENLIARATGPLNSEYQISFNHFVPKDFSAADFNLMTTPPSEIAWEMLPNMTIRVIGGPWSSSYWLTIQFVTPVMDEFGFPLENREITVVPPLAPAPLPMSSSIETSAVAVTSTIAVAAVGTGVAVGGGSLALALLSQMQYFSYIGTAQYTMGGDMNNFYTSLNQKSTLPNPFSRSKGAGRRLDTAEELIDVSDFLDSAGQYVTLLFGIVVVHFALWGLKKSFGHKWTWLVRLEHKFVWGVYLYFWYFAYLDLLVAALLQVKNEGEEWGQGRKTACNILAILFLVMTGVTPFGVFWLIWKKHGDLFAEGGNWAKDKFGSLTSDLRSDSRLSKYLVPVYYLQRFIYAFLLAFLRSTRTAQVIVLVLPCGIMALFVVLTRPLFRRSCRMLHIVAEVDALIVFLILCAAALLYDSLDDRLSWMIVALTLKSFLCTILIFLIETAAAVRESCHRKKVYAAPASAEVHDIKTVNLPFDTEISFADTVLFSKRDGQKLKTIEELPTDRHREDN